MQCFQYNGLGQGGGESACKITGQPWFHCLLSPACTSGSYRADMDTPHCLKCPQHSAAEAEGATICMCESGHHRAPGEGPQAACTRESGGRAWSSVRRCGTFVEPGLGLEFSSLLDTGDCSGC